MPKKKESSGQTELLKRLQKRLWTSVAREALSPVTLGIAHDLNNQLTGILSVSDLCLHETNLNPKLREQLQIIKGSSERAAALVRTLFTEHQANVGKSELHDLNSLVKSYGELAGRMIPKSIAINFAFATDPLPVKVDAVAFRTAFLHLVLNGTEAIEGRGELQIGTLLKAKPPSTAPDGIAKRKGHWAACSVRDSGRGFRIDPLEFQPLPTTKYGKGGAGIGLYFANDFAKVSGGFFCFEPNRKGGTIASIWIPAAKLD